MRRYNKGVVIKERGEIGILRQIVAHQKRAKVRSRGSKKMKKTITIGHVLAGGLIF